jgi:acetyl-CoA carboxylase carboxyl transferase subunit alpha
MREMSRLRVPTIAIITGEGGSGGALALAVADRVLIFENAIYSVIPPEGCAAILWRDASFKDKAAEAMRISADEVRGFGCVDDIVPEPAGGAHTDPQKAGELLAQKLRWHLNELKALPTDELLRRRYQKFRNIAQFYTV